MLEKINETIEYLSEHDVKDAELGIILGTGLGGLVNHIEIEKSIEYSQIPNFPEATVESHAGRLIVGYLSGKKVVVMDGRFHFYEGYSMHQITFPIRVMKMLGVNTLFVSNACGGINPDYKPASLMIIDDHINMLPGNPLVGKNHTELGPRFVDMSQPYDSNLIKMMEKIATDEDMPINKGVYVSWIGPSLETRAEYRFIRLMGADVVGMSTVPEVIVANHMGMKVAAVSVITDLCDPDNLAPVHIEDLLENAAKAEVDLIKLFKKLALEL
jgi:purine-nucleoside phosphorylase